VTANLTHLLPRVAVVTVLYRCEKFMHGLLTSVAQVDYPRERLEFHLVDNGAGDGTLAAAKKEIESGKSFASVAKHVSIDPTSKASGGLLPGAGAGATLTAGDFDAITRLTRAALAGSPIAKYMLAEMDLFTPAPPPAPPCSPDGFGPGRPGGTRRPGAPLPEGELAGPSGVAL